MKSRIIELASQGHTKTEIARMCNVSWPYVHKVLSNLKVDVRKESRHEPVFTKAEFEEQIKRYGSITNIHSQNALVRGWDWVHINSLYRLAIRYGLDAPRHIRSKVKADGTWRW